MATKVQSRKCPACSNMVRFDYPTFPYCRFHEHLGKDDLSIMKRDTQHSFESNREMLYKPEDAKIPKSQMVKQSLVSAARGTGMALKTIGSIANEWNKITSSINTKNPADCFRNIDTIVGSMQNIVDLAMKSDKGITNPRTGVAECVNSTVLLPDGTLKNLSENHRVVFSSSDNGPTIIIDGAPASALYGVIGDDQSVDDVFASGQTNFSDGLTISSLYEYAGYSTLNIDVMRDAETGEVLWDNNVGLGKDSQDVTSQRDMLERSPQIAFPPVVRRRSPTDEDLAKMNSTGREESSADDDLEKLFFEDMEG